MPDIIRILGIDHHMSKQKKNTMKCIHRIVDLHKKNSGHIIAWIECINDPTVPIMKLKNQICVIYLLPTSTFINRVLI